MTKSFAIAALAAASALIAGCLQGCVSETMTTATNSAITFYCHSSMDKYIQHVQVEKTRRTRAMCKQFQANMQAAAHHSSKTEHSNTSMGVNASLEIWCMSKADEEWHTCVITQIEKRETECVANLTQQVTNISSDNTADWTAKYNMVMNFSYQFFLSAQMNITAGFESSLNSTLDAVDHTAEGVRNITSHITTSVDVYVEQVCTWINYDYIEKIEIDFTKQIENACNLGNAAAGQVAAGAEASTSHSSGSANHSMGIEANFSMHYEQECKDYNTEKAQAALTKQTSTLMVECKTYVITHIKEKGESAATITDCAKSFLEGQQENLKTVEHNFQAEIKTVFEFHAEASASSSVSSKAALPPALSRSLVRGSASTKPVVLIVGIATMVLVVLAVGATIRKRRDTPINDRSLLQTEVECGEEE